MKTSGPSIEHLLADLDAVSLDWAGDAAVEYCASLSGEIPITPGDLRQKFERDFKGRNLPPRVWEVLMEALDAAQMAFGGPSRAAVQRHEPIGMPQWKTPSQTRFNMTSPAWLHSVENEVRDCRTTRLRTRSMPCFLRSISVPYRTRTLEAAWGRNQQPGGPMSMPYGAILLLTVSGRSTDGRMLPDWLRVYSRPNPRLMTRRNESGLNDCVASITLRRMSNSCLMLCDWGKSRAFRDFSEKRGLDVRTTRRRLLVGCAPTSSSLGH